MASFQKRGKTWRAIVRRGGQTLTKTCDTRAEAEDWATRTEAAILDGAKPDDAPKVVKMQGTTLAELFARYADEVSPAKKGERWERVRLTMLARFAAFQQPAAGITGPDMADWRDARLKMVSASSVNRELNLISAVYQHAIREWRLDMTSNPVRLISLPRKPRARTQRVSQADRKAIITKLGWDGKARPEGRHQWAAWAFYFALATAMRKGEILSLHWRDIHPAERRAHLSDTKNGDERDVPLSKEALALLALLDRGAPDTKVVPLTSGHLDVIFRRAKIDCDLKHVRFHDARREAATTMAPKLTNVLELAAITGHRSLKVLMGYYAPKASDLAAKLD